MPKLVGAAVCSAAQTRSRRGRRSRLTTDTTHTRSSRDKIEIRQTTFARFDVSRTGQLEEPELRTFLEELELAAGESLTEDELRFVMRRGDKDSSGGLDPIELPAAVAHWRNYCAVRPRVRELFARYDTDRSGRLDRDQLWALLAEGLGGAHEVDESTLDQVFGYADVTKDGLISQPELSLAVAKFFALNPQPGCGRGSRCSA